MEEPKSVIEFRNECWRTGIRSSEATMRWGLPLWYAHKDLATAAGVPRMKKFKALKKTYDRFEQWWAQVRGPVSFLPTNPRLPGVRRPSNRKPRKPRKPRQPRAQAFDSAKFARLMELKSPNAFTKQEREAFFKSQKWKEKRYQVFLRDGKVCACCGANGPGIVFHIDHVRPLWTHPELALDVTNLQVLCAPCNEGKGALDSTDWRTK